MDNRVKFYCWLISLLERRRMTFDEIADSWMEATANAFKEQLTLRTFHRHRKTIESQFGIAVECSGKADGYRYYIRKDTVECDEITEWLLSSLRMASLRDTLQYHNKVMLEAPPRNTEYLDDILMAIDKHYLLKFGYTTPYGVQKDMTLAPCLCQALQATMVCYRSKWRGTGAVSTVRPHSAHERGLRETSASGKTETTAHPHQLLRRLLRHHAYGGRTDRGHPHPCLLPRIQLHRGGAATREPAKSA